MSSLVKANFLICTCHFTNYLTYLTQFLTFFACNKVILQNDSIKSLQIIKTFCARNTNLSTGLIVISLIKFNVGAKGGNPKIANAQKDLDRK